MIRTRVPPPLSPWTIWKRPASLPDLKRQLSNISGSLFNLSRRSFPSYRPIIVEYAKLVALMQTDKLDRRKAALENQPAPGNTGTFHENGPARTGLYGLV